MANAIDVSVAGEMIAVGYYQGDSIVSLLGLDTLEPIGALRGSYFQCLDLKLNHATNELLFLAEQDLGVVHFCRAQIGVVLDRIHPRLKVDAPGLARSCYPRRRHHRSSEAYRPRVSSS